MVDELKPILEARSMDEIGEHIGRFCRDIGYQFFSYGVVKPSPMENMVLRQVISNCPAWQEIYSMRRYANIDPVVAHVRRSTLPLRWEPAMYCTGEQRCLEAHARSFGLIHGMTLPVRERHGGVGLLNVASDGADGEPAPDLGQVAKLSLLSAYVEERVAFIAERASAEARSKRVDLSRREMQCLQWCSVGKTSWEIGAILGISERTVNFHIGNVVRKLDAKGRRHAVVKAIGLGMLGAG